MLCEQDAGYQKNASNLAFLKATKKLMDMLSQKEGVSPSPLAKSCLEWLGCFSGTALLPPGKDASQVMPRAHLGQRIHW